MPFKKSGKEVKTKIICKECGKEFEVWTYKKDRIKYCSNKCKYANTVPKYRRIKDVLNESKLFVLTCQNIFCKKKFLVTAYQLSAGRKYCCRECYLYARKNQYKKDIKTNDEIKDQTTKRDIWRLNT